MRNDINFWHFGFRNIAFRYFNNSFFCNFGFDISTNCGFQNSDTLRFYILQFDILVFGIVSLNSNNIPCPAPNCPKPPPPSPPKPAASPPTPKNPEMNSASFDKNAAFLLIRIMAQRISGKSTAASERNFHEIIYKNCDFVTSTEIKFESKKKRQNKFLCHYASCWIKRRENMT